MIVPAYNTAKYITRTIESVLGQTEQSVEVIVVDDASTDDTAQVVRGIPDERVRLFVNEQNRGPSYSRNRGISEAKGEWIAPLDSDDWFAPERLERLLWVAEAEDADMIADDVYRIEDMADRPYGTLLNLGGWRFHESRRIDAVEFVETNMPGRRLPRLGLTKPLMKRDFLTRNNLSYDETIRGDEDFHLYLACLIEGARFIVLPEPHYFYRSREGSIVAGRRLDWLHVLRKGNVRLLYQALEKDDQELLSLLSERFSAIEQRIAYYDIVQPLKEGRFSVALAKMVRNPTVFTLFAAYVPQTFYYRLRRLAGRLRNAWDHRSDDSGTDVL